MCRNDKQLTETDIATGYTITPKVLYLLFILSDATFHWDLLDKRISKPTP